MKDKSLDIFLTFLFGISGMTVLILAWTWPMPGSERVFTVFVGVIGCIFASMWLRNYISLNKSAVAGEVAVNIKNEEKP